MAWTASRPHLGIVLACAALAGCQESYYAETVIRPDGSLRRAIFQPFADLPESARQPTAWDRVTYASDPNQLERRGWPTVFPSFPKQTSIQSSSNIVAWKQAGSYREIPDHVVMLPPEGVKVPAGRLVREYRRTDLGFLIEHRWKETLTDCVTLDDMRKARGEFADLAIDLSRDLFETLYGDRYEASGLIRWLRTEGKEWLAEATDLLFDRDLRRDSNKLRDAFLAVCARHGLVLAPKGRIVEDAELGPRLKAFAKGLLRAHVRDKAGRPLDEQAVDRLFDELARDQTDPQRLARAWEQLATAKYGGKPALELRLLGLYVRVMGLYQFPFRHAVFDYVLSIPGDVVETNGKALSANRVRWKFSASEAYPFGYVMACRSLDPVPEARALRPAGALAPRDARLRFAEIVSASEPLRKVLIACRRARSLAPLEEYRASVVKRPDATEEARALGRLSELLGIDRD